MKGISKTDEYIVARTEEAAYAVAREKYGDSCYLQQESDVLDTWFSRFVHLNNGVFASNVSAWTGQPFFFYLFLNLFLWK